MAVTFPSRARIRSASPANGVGHSARSPTVRRVWWPAMPVSMATPWSSAACTCRAAGLARSINPALLDQIAALKLLYLAEVPHDTRVWRQRPATAIPARGKRGPAPRHERLAAGAPLPVRVDVLASQVPAAQWQRYQIKEGAKGPLVAEFAFLRVVPVRDELPGAESWLVLR